MTDTTTRIFVESGNFDAISVRKTSQRLGLRTDSSVRFEKGQDVHNTSQALSRFLDILMQYQSNIRIGAFSEFSDSCDEIVLNVPHVYLEKKIGTALNSEKVIHGLQKLGFEVTTEDKSYFILVPSWRAT